MISCQEHRFLDLKITIVLLQKVLVVLKIGLKKRLTIAQSIGILKNYVTSNRDRLNIEEVKVYKLLGNEIKNFKLSDLEYIELSA